MRHAATLAAMVMAMLALPAAGQSQPRDPWAGWDAGRADRLAARSATVDARDVRVIRAQPLRGDAVAARYDDLPQRVVPQHVVTHRQDFDRRDQHVAATVRYADVDDRARWNVGVSAGYVQTSGYRSNTYFAAPGVTYVHQRQCGPIVPPIYMYRHTYCPPPVVVRPVCPPVTYYRPVYRPVYRTACPPGYVQPHGSSLRIGITYRD